MRLRSLIVGLLIAAPFYLLLIDTVTVAECAAAAVIVIAAAGIYAVVHSQGIGDAAYELRPLRRAWRVAAMLVPQCLMVCYEALAQLRTPRQSRGSFRCVRFRAGDDRDPRDLGRRALVEALGSLTPNTIVIGVDPERDLLLVHQLHRTGGSDQLDPLELG